MGVQHQHAGVRRSRLSAGPRRRSQRTWEICPGDPVKYDFALTRYGIREEMTVEELFAKWHLDR